MSQARARVVEERRAQAPEERAPEIDDLVRLARDKSDRARSSLAATIDDLYLGRESVLTERDRESITDILWVLIHDVETVVRHAISVRLSERPDTPPALLELLADNETEISYPILAKSEVLKDPELIEAVQHRVMEIQLAASLQASLNDPVSKMLVENENAAVVKSLLKDKDPRVAEPGTAHSIDNSAQPRASQNPLLSRRDLPVGLARRLDWGVAAALRDYIVNNFTVEPGDLDEAIESAVKEAIAEDNGATRPTTAHGASSGQTHDDAADLEVLLNALRQGEVAEFLRLFAGRSNLRLTLVRRLLFEEGGDGLAIVCRALGIDKHGFISIFLRFRQGRLGEQRVADDELTRAVSFYERVEPEAARSLLRRWQRDPAYLNALRLIEDTHD